MIDMLTDRQMIDRNKPFYVAQASLELVILWLLSPQVLVWELLCTNHGWCDIIFLFFILLHSDILNWPLFTLSVLKNITISLNISILQLGAHSIGQNKTSIHTTLF